MRRLSAVAIAAAATIALLAGPAGAQEYPPDGATCGASSTVPEPGDPVTVSCGGYEPGTPYTITFESAPQVLSTGTVSANGTITDTVTIPGDASPGSHTLTISGIEEGGEPVSISIPITVAGAGAGLAVTGGNISMALIMLAGLLAAATAALLVGRRRPRATS